MPVAIEVTKGMTVLPLKPYVSRKVRMTRGDLPYQMGLPRKMTSYCDASFSVFLMAGR
jgi:hypothetical protein